MGKGHSLSAAVGWVGGSAVLASVGHSLPARVVLVGGLVSAGCALLPDIDYPGSTVSRTLGPVTAGVARLVGWAAGRLRMSSCRHCATRRADGGHRAVTHTAVFAAGIGAVTTMAVAVTGWAVLVVVWLSVALAARVALSRRQRGTLGAAVLATVAAVVLWAAVGTVDGWWWLGVAVAWGCLAHDLGDCLTRSAAPLLWPLRIRGCAWWPVGMPRLLRFRTGGWVEKAVTAVMAVGLVAASGYVLAAG